ncbi:MAG: bifunctional hydroxymethylpyrimidine kinase/phosphomethylpyrimidine kinase [Rhodospirillales bacterium]|nr:bifunctional hydroxymethylpyrimidine kinase/phosphomethylpyrimidine kinase [Rhodospirillales bacterium]
MKGRVLIVAGSDSGGGAGIQADIKTVTALGGYAMTAITALTAQNTQGVFGIHEVPPDFIARQLAVVLSDLGADCVKIGMLHRPEVIDAVVAVLAAPQPDGAQGIPVVVDPVMVAKGGARLLTEDSVVRLARHLLPRATVLTPNIPEAEALTGLAIRAPDDVMAAGRALLGLGAAAALVKGGHLEGDVVTDVLFTKDGVESFSSPRIPTTSTHGTGCTLASAIATGLAQRLDLRAAVVRARAYVQEALRTAPAFGRGHGPLNHGHTVTPFNASKSAR